MWQAVHMRLLLRKLLLSILLWAPTVLAWGGLGHRVTALIAEPLLTAAARQQVRQLLGDESLATASMYMDVQRQALHERWPAAERWHYDNQPVCGKARYCADGQCATRQIERFRSVLADQRTSPSERALALRLLIHMLGDIHQPLHMADNADRGGNNVWVRLSVGGQRYRLHEVLDNVLLKQLAGRQRSETYAHNLQQRYQSRFSAWQQGNVNQWAQQTHQLAVMHSYASLPGFACQADSHRAITLPDAYVDDAQRYLPEQLAKAGARIAAVLNATLQ